MGTSRVASVAAVRSKLAELPRVRLASLPTPLDDCPRLSHELGGPRILVKRDDLTGLAFGGNKVRQHEYILGSALAEGADCFVQGAASQSNHSRQLAAAGARLGYETFLLPKLDVHSAPMQGNYLIDYILGATISPIRADASSIVEKDALAYQLRMEGRKPYITGMGAPAALSLAALAYVDAMCEIVEQSEDYGLEVGAIYTTSQGSTQAGLLLAAEILGLNTRVIGISPMDSSHEGSVAAGAIAAMARDAGQRIGFKSHVAQEDVELRFDFVGTAYGEPSVGSIRAIDLLGRTEGIILDPVYSGKGCSGLIHDVETGRFGNDEVVVFIHTGGLPALFAHAAAVVEGLEAIRNV